MSIASFFANDLVNVLGEECIITSSLANTRDSPLNCFTVPQHQVGTNNLLVFVGGILTTRNTQYMELSQNEIYFYEPVPIDKDYFAILIPNSFTNGESDSTAQSLGDWKNNINYVPNSIVVFDQAIWKAIVTNIASPPSSTNTNWQIIGISKLTQATDFCYEMGRKADKANTYTKSEVNAFVTQIYTAMQVVDGGDF